MIGFFPTLLKDELFFSGCARYQDRVGFPVQSSIGVELFGHTRSQRFDVGVPSHLGFFVNALPTGHRLSVDRIIDKYTLFPFFAPFLLEERVKRARQSMEGANALTARMFSGSAGTTIAMPAYLRFCPICSAEDRKEIKETYWRRLHQLPGVEVCPIHAVFLESSNVAIRPVSGSNILESAERAIVDRPAVSLDIKNRKDQILQRIALDAAWLLQQRDIVQGYDAILEKYIYLLHQKGLLTNNIAVRAKKLVQGLEDYYTPELLESLKCNFQRSNLSNWATTIIKDLKKGKFHHPLQHLLLIQFLGHTAASFFALTERHLPFGAGPWPCVNPICNNYQKPVISVCSIKTSWTTRNKEDVKATHGTFTCECGFSYSRTKQESQLADTYSANIINTRGHLWEAVLRRLWADPNLSITDIAVRLCANRRSEFTIKSQASKLGLSFPRKSRKGANPALELKKKISSRKKKKRPASEESTRNQFRKRLLKMRRQHPNMLRTELRDKFAGMKWLAAHDREWLEENLPPRRDHSFEWSKLDIQIAASALEAAERIKNLLPPVKISCLTLGKETGYYEYLRSTAGRLPKSAKVLSEVLESTVDFAVRKIKMVATQFQSGSVPPHRSQLLCLARIYNKTRRDPKVLAAADAAILSIMKYVSR